jgi:hypothetical protein
MKFEDKMKILQQLETSPMIKNLHTLETELETKLGAQMTFTRTNHEYLASGSADCQAVKAILAELVVTAEGKNAGERDAWLTRQRAEYKPLEEAITKQRMVMFNLEDLEIQVKMIQRRIDGLLAVIRLRTAQINFFAGSEE